MKTKTFYKSFLFLLACLFLLTIMPDVYCEALKPKRLLIYYGSPPLINQAAATESAIAEFIKYDYIILGEGYEEPNHQDHIKTKEILTHTQMQDKMVFGYIDLGVTKGAQNLSIELIKSHIDNWKGTGADGIFFDNYGSDYGNSKSRQNQAVKYAHDQTMYVAIYATQPEYAFDSNIDLWDPNETEINLMDFYLYNGHQITNCNYVTERDWQDKANRIVAFKNKIQFRVLSITTCEKNAFYDEEMFFYSWVSALMYEHEATGWGEKDFSAGSNNAPFRARPDINAGTYFTTGIINNTPIYSRKTNLLEIFINTSEKKYGFVLPKRDDDVGICFIGTDLVY